MEYRRHSDEFWEQVVKEYLRGGGLKELPCQRPLTADDGRKRHEHV